MDRWRLIRGVWACGLFAFFSHAGLAAGSERQKASAPTASNAAVPAVEAQRWLSRIQLAPAQRNFQGTFVVTASGSMSSARMLHYQIGQSQYEFIESLNGQARQVYRHDDLIQTMWPQDKVALIEQRENLGSFPSLLEGGAPQIVEFYQLRVLGVDRIAGRFADVLSLTPRDKFRFAVRLWSDQETGLLLREDKLNADGQLLESSAFSDVVIGGRAQPETVLGDMRKLDGYRVVRPLLLPTELEAEGWVQRESVPGFRRVSCIRRPLFSASETDAKAIELRVLQTIYTDGLTYVSLFIEPYDAKRHPRPVLTSIGATHTLMIQRGDWWITVVGDVPATALRAFARSVERK